MVDRVFLDANVVMDYLINRRPFSEHANQIFTFAEHGKLQLFVSSLSFCNLHYLLRKIYGNDQTCVKLEALTRIVGITTVSEMEIKKALTSAFSDFEDGVQAASAEAPNLGIRYLVTRDSKGFISSSLAVLDPESFVKMFENRKAVQ